MRSGEITVSEGMRQVGLVEKHSPIGGEIPDKIYFGRGDKWREATEPLVRYLAAWKKKGYEFKQLNPRTAGSRLKTIDKLMVELSAAREDLAWRSKKATSKVEDN